MSFEPKILGFLCNWCSYAGADLAGVSRIQYPPNLRVIRVMCSGRVDPKFVFEGLRTGLDGVIVMGCHPGDCHYLEGNYEAEMKFHMVQQFLSLIGMEDRVRLEWVSASEGNRFAEVITDFTDQIKEVGPSPVGGKDSDRALLEQLEAMEWASTSYRMRALIGRERKITQDENVYGEVISAEEFDEILTSAIHDEYIRHRILLSLKNTPGSVVELAKKVGVEPSDVLSHVLVLQGRNQVSMREIVGDTPMYINIMEEV